MRDRIKSRQNSRQRITGNFSPTDNSKFNEIHHYKSRPTSIEYNSPRSKHSMSKGRQCDLTLDSDAFTALTQSVDPSMFKKTSFLPTFEHVWPKAKYEIHKEGYFKQKKDRVGLISPGMLSPKASSHKRKIQIDNSHTISRQPLQKEGQQDIEKVQTLNNINLDDLQDGTLLDLILPYAEFHYKKQRCQTADFSGNKKKKSRTKESINETLMRSRLEFWDSLKAKNSQDAKLQFMRKSREKATIDWQNFNDYSNLSPIKVSLKVEQPSKKSSRRESRLQRQSRFDRSRESSIIVENQNERVNESVKQIEQDSGSDTEKTQIDNQQCKSDTKSKVLSDKILSEKAASPLPKQEQKTNPRVKPKRLKSKLKNGEHCHECKETVQTLVKFPQCSHNLCDECVDLLEMNVSQFCQLCLKQFNKFFTDLKQKNVNKLSDKEGLLAIGNTFELVRNPDNDLKSESYTLFTTINNSKKVSEKLIKKVVYHMHPTLKKGKITTTQHPYLASFPHGPFVVKVEIIFQQWTKLEDLQLEYLLNSDSNYALTEIVPITQSQNVSIAQQQADKLKIMGEQSKVDSTRYENKCLLSYLVHQTIPKTIIKEPVEEEHGSESDQNEYNEAQRKMKRAIMDQYAKNLLSLVNQFKEILSFIDEKKVDTELVSKLHQILSLQEKLAAEIKRTGTDDTKEEVQLTLIELQKYIVLRLTAKQRLKIDYQDGKCINTGIRISVHIANISSPLYHENKSQADCLKQYSHLNVLNVLNEYEDEFWYIYVSEQVQDVNTIKPSDSYLRSTALSLFEVTKYLHSEGLVHKTPLNLNSFGVNEKGEVRIQHFEKSDKNMSEESLQLSYKKVVWDIGFILYSIIDDSHSKDPLRRMKERIRKKPYDFRENFWKPISVTGVDFVDQILYKQIQTIEKAFKHSWLQDDKVKLRLRQQIYDYDRKIKKKFADYQENCIRVKKGGESKFTDDKIKQILELFYGRPYITKKVKSSEAYHQIVDDLKTKLHELNKKEVKEEQKQEE